MAKCTSVALWLLLLVSSATWASATVYTVGDSTGWTTGYDYSTWLSGKSFVVGDKLVFNYAAGAHTVDEVTASSYNSCSTSNALSSATNGQTTITLTTSGTHYYICGIPGHCSGGMKLAVPVSASSSGSTPPAGGGSTAPPASSTTPTPTDNNNSGAAGSLSSVYYSVTVVVFGLMGLRMGLF